MKSYLDKDRAYFNHARQDIRPLLPKLIVESALEVGCANGATLGWLKSEGIVRNTVGIELFEHAASIAEQQVDIVLCGPAEEKLEELPTDAAFDLVLCLDVLEHMVDPWAFLTRLAPLVKPGGLLIASIPNVRYIGVLAPLLLRGDWCYRDEGVLDRTHLRFFTRKSAVELMQTGGLQIVHCRGNVPDSPSRVHKLDRLSKGLLHEFCVYQWIISARRPIGT